VENLWRGKSTDAAKSWLELGKSWKIMENPSINKEFVAAMVIVAEFFFLNMANPRCPCLKLAKIYPP
jgi:hypothetical protein